jgi:hypothetical protein
MNDLELFNAGNTLDERMRAVAQGTVLVDVIKALLGEARTALEDSVRQVSEQTGTAFTARKSGVTALVTDPQPKPRVTDPQAFGEWCWHNAPAAYLKVERRERVEVVDHAGAAAAIDALVGDTDAVDATTVLDLIGALAIRTEYVLPSDPFTPLIDKGRVVVTPDGVVDVETGEEVPGTTVTVARATLQVRLDKAAKAAAKRQVRDALGLPELVEVTA